MADHNLGPFRIRPRGTYKDNEKYRYLDLVYYDADKCSYICRKYETIDNSVICQGINPTNEEYWMKITERGATGFYEMEYYPIISIEPNNSIYTWDFDITDKIRIDGDDQINEKLVIENVDEGCCGVIITRKSSNILPDNSDYSIDFNYVNIINDNQYYLYTFIYADMGAGPRFIWNRTVINKS